MGKLKTRLETHKLYHVPGCHKLIKCKKNSVRFSTKNSKEHEMMKALVCYKMQESGHHFITEACCNETGDIIDIVDLDTGEEIEIVNTHGLEKAVVNGRRVVKISQND